jgi:DNA mismatch endonuclease, patch repair protein
MAATGSRNNQSERALRSALHRRGFRFRLHKRLLSQSRRTVDIVFVGARVAVFVDGCFWHGCPAHGTWPKNNALWWRQKIQTNRRRDRDTTKQLKHAGWYVVRVWEHDSLPDATTRISRVLRTRARHRSQQNSHR